MIVDRYYYKNTRIRLVLKYGSDARIKKTNTTVTKTNTNL